MKREKAKAQNIVCIFMYARGLILNPALSRITFMILIEVCLAWILIIILKYDKDFKCNFTESSLFIMSVWRNINIVYKMLQLIIQN